MPRILIVDDMAIFREPIAAAFRREGYEVACATNGAEAIREIASLRPDLVLLDVAMPVMDGLRCLSKIREHPALRSLPVIMLTALSERKLLQQAVRLGIQGCLLKSQFSLSDMFARVRKALSQSPAQEQSEQSRCRSRSAERISHPDSDAGAVQAVLPPSQPDSAPTALDRNTVLAKVRQEAQMKAVPTVLHHVISLTQSNRSSFDEVADAIRQDHALALRVLKFANSSFFGASKQAHSLTEAGQRIGMSGICNAIATVLTIDHFGSVNAQGLNPQHFWRHSLATAALAELLGRAVGTPNSEQLFLAGLLHDVGRLVLSSVFPVEYDYVLATAARRNVDTLSVEHEVFGVGHDEVTLEVLTQWDTPRALRESAGAHALPIDRVAQVAEDAESARIVALANRLAHAALLGDSGNPVLLEVNEHIGALKMLPDKVVSLVAEAERKSDETELFYASRADCPFQGRLAPSLSANIDERFEVAVLNRGASLDPITLFLQALGWLEKHRPQFVAIRLDAAESTNRIAVALSKFERNCGQRLPILAVTASAPTELPLDDFEGRPVVAVQAPGRYEHLISGLVALRNRSRRPEYQAAVR